MCKGKTLEPLLPTPASLWLSKWLLASRTWARWRWGSPRCTYAHSSYRYAWGSHSSHLCLKSGFWGTPQPLPTPFGMMTLKRQTLRVWLLFVACGPGNIKGMEEEVQKYELVWSQKTVCGESWLWKCVWMDCRHVGELFDFFFLKKNTLFFWMEWVFFLHSGYMFTFISNFVKADFPTGNLPSERL